jgi:hypothetical protein
MITFLIRNALSIGLCHDLVDALVLRFFKHLLSFFNGQRGISF